MTYDVMTYDFMTYDITCTMSCQPHDAMTYFFFLLLFLTFIKSLFQFKSVYRTGTIHNLLHNPINFQ